MNSDTHPTARADAPTVEVDFLPVVDTEAGIVSAYYCRPHLGKPDGGILVDEDVLALGTDGQAINDNLVVKTMLATLTAGVAKARKLVLQGSEAKVLLPINGAALIMKQVAAEFANFNRHLEEPVRQSIAYEVTNINDDQKLSYLDDIAIVLYPFCATYGARASLKTANYKVYSACNYNNISINLLDKPWPVQQLETYLQNYANLTGASRLNAYVHGLGTPALAEAAMAAGLRFLSGKGVSVPEA